jgi:hypothetical protein
MLKKKLAFYDPAKVRNLGPSRGILYREVDQPYGHLLQKTRRYTRVLRESNEGKRIAQK